MSWKVSILKFHHKLDCKKSDHSTMLWSLLNSTYFHFFRYFQKEMFKFKLFQVCISHVTDESGVNCAWMTNCLQLIINLLIRKRKWWASSTSLIFDNRTVLRRCKTIWIEQTSALHFHIQWILSFCSIKNDKWFDFQKLSAGKCRQ